MQGCPTTLLILQGNEGRLRDVLETKKCVWGSFRVCQGMFRVIKCVWGSFRVCQDVFGAVLGCVRVCLGNSRVCQDVLRYWMD